MQRAGGWKTDNGEEVRTGVEAEHVLRRSVAAGELDISFFPSAGGDKRIQFLTNGSRVMLVVWGQVGADEGVFAVDPDASGQTQGGYRLTNGQVDSYMDNETVPFSAGVDAVRLMVENDVLDPRLPWRTWSRRPIGGCGGTRSGRILGAANVARSGVRGQVASGERRGYGRPSLHVKGLSDLALRLRPWPTRSSSFYRRASCDAMAGSGRERLRPSATHASLPN